MPTRMKKHRVLWAAILLAAIVAAACSGSDDRPSQPATIATDSAGQEATTQEAADLEPDQDAGPFPLTVTDSSGADVIFEAAPERIISYSAGSTEILYAVGAQDQIIAVDRFSDFPAATADLAKLEYSSPDSEAALDLRPDLVIMVTRQEEQVAQYRDLGMRVFFLREADSLEGVIESIMEIGAITGHPSEAETLVHDLRARIDAVAAALADATEGPRVFFEVTADLYTAAPDTFIGAMLSLLKAHNIAAGAETAFPQLGAEAVVAADPEVILLSDARHGESLATVRDRPGWSGISAVVNERVHPINPDIVNRPGPRIVEGLETMAMLLYPDQFGGE